MFLSGTTSNCTNFVSPSSFTVAWRGNFWCWMTVSVYSYLYNQQWNCWETVLHTWINLVSISSSSLCTLFVKNQNVIQSHVLKRYWMMWLFCRNNDHSIAVMLSSHRHGCHITFSSFTLIAGQYFFDKQMMTKVNWKVHYKYGFIS
jgi:hypothetical protein